MKTQVQILIPMLRKGWVSTTDAFNIGITSFHRRLTDFRESHFSLKRRICKPALICYRVGMQQFQLISRERDIKTRWGMSKIKEWRLVAVK